MYFIFNYRFGYAEEIFILIFAALVNRREGLITLVDLQQDFVVPENLLQDLVV